MNKSEGQKMLTRARKAGDAYAREQLDSEHFQDWVADQMYDRSVPDDDLPRTKEDALRVARNFLVDLSHDTGRGLRSQEVDKLADVPAYYSEQFTFAHYGVKHQDLHDAFWEGFNRVLGLKNVREWLADEVMFRANERLGLEPNARTTIEIQGPPKVRLIHVKDKTYGMWMHGEPGLLVGTVTLSPQGPKFSSNHAASLSLHDKAVKIVVKWWDGGGHSGFRVGARVLVDGRDEAIVKQFFPYGSSSFMFPHYKLDFVGGDRNVAVNVKRVGVERMKRNGGMSLSERREFLRFCQRASGVQCRNIYDEEKKRAKRFIGTDKEEYYEECRDIALDVCRERGLL